MWIAIVLKIITGLLLLWISLEDIKNKKVSFYKLLLFIPVGILYLLFGEELRYLQVGAGFLLGIAILLLSLATHEKIGLADAACIIFLGVIVGFSETFLIFVLALFSTACFSAVLLLLKKAELKTALPFFPFLFLAYVGVILW